ncbi:hypothetical protein [Ornithinimicrobium sp. W1665]|uniref:hypothetical protein n=1 Tax=Ornithinimicrobium sp. W1665 TaxID=3416666 RepID=UPI003D6C5192
MSRQTTGARRRARTRPAVFAALAALVLSGLGVPAVSAHDGEDHFGSPYVPPPVTAAGPVGGAYSNVAQRDRHEVWLVDQSNTDNTSAPSFGGRIYIYDGSDLRHDTAAAQAEVVELSAATADLCREATGVTPVRPHMIYFNATQSHAVLSFVASGHVVIIDASTREPAACFRTEVGAAGAVQAHAAVPTPDDRFIIVANQNGKKSSGSAPTTPAAPSAKRPRRRSAWPPATPPTATRSRPRATRPCALTTRRSARSSPPAATRRSSRCAEAASLLSTRTRRP